MIIETPKTIADLFTDVVNKLKDHDMVLQQTESENALQISHGGKVIAEYNVNTGEAKLSPELSLTSFTVARFVFKNIHRMISCVSKYEQLQEMNISKL